MAGSNHTGIGFNFDHEQIDVSKVRNPVFGGSLKGTDKRCVRISVIFIAPSQSDSYMIVTLSYWVDKQIRHEASQLSNYIVYLAKRGGKSMSAKQQRETTVDAVIVGAGFSGLYLLHRFRKLGLTTRVLERGGGVGGTWYWNRYPGARCDVESMQYSFFRRRAPTRMALAGKVLGAARHFGLRKSRG